jgi:hypothetical protein
MLTLPSPHHVSKLDTSGGGRLAGDDSSRRSDLGIRSARKRRLSNRRFNNMFSQFSYRKQDVEG